MAVTQRWLLQWVSGALICTVVGMSGCSAGKPPTAALSRADLAVQEANKSKAPQYASLQLQTAREQFDRARQAMAEEQYDQARRLAEQALVNAQLAEAQAEAVSARQAAEELRKSIESLRSEAERASQRN
jgi:predicted S18 family serine protease